MTISAKLVDINGLEFAVSDETDTIDANGFSDVINTISAKTAKFSDTSVMQANPGLRIGITQLKVVNVGGAARLGTVIRGAFVTTASVGEIVVIDFGSIETADLSGTIQFPSGGSNNVDLEFSTDDVTYFVASNLSGGSLNNTFPITTQTYRFARMFVNINAGVVTPQTISETLISSDVIINIRSSATLDTADGTVLLANEIILDNTTVTFDTDLLLTGAGQFVTLEVVSFNNQNVDVSLSEITSIKEV